MTDPVRDTSTAPTRAEIQAQLDRMLVRPSFIKAWRDSRLLRYLVAASCADPPRLLNEYAIGIDVFGRAPATYSPGEDPIVRVQLGRLRQRLDAYYRGEGASDPIRIALALRSYAPRIERNAGSPPITLRLAVLPSASGRDDEIGSFIAGLGEELQHRLHQQLGARFARAARSDHAYAAPPSPVSSHLLECSVRTDGTNTRTTLRLIDLVRGCILWSRQVDHDADLTIACQERLATLCCAALLELTPHLATSA